MPIETIEEIKNIKQKVKEVSNLTDDQAEDWMNKELVCFNMCTVYQLISLGRGQSVLEHLNQLNPLKSLKTPS